MRSAARRSPHRRALRQALTAGLVAVVAAATVLTGLQSVSAAGPRPVSAPDPGGRLERVADRALARAQEALSGDEVTGGRPSAGGGREVTLALRDLRVALPHLSAAERAQAETLLARPYTGQRVCGSVVCVHFAAGRGTAAQARTTLTVMQSVWAFEVSRLGYRAPAPDGTDGGDARFDVYLADIGNQGIYGYCAPEFIVAGQPNRGTSYCVLDDDFAEFPLPGDPSRRVTAAHEFFHAIQFNYDYLEDPWVLEATAVWMEEQYAGDVNDNRQYIAFGQLRAPGVSLDLFDTSRLNYYGNWLFFQRFAQKYGQAAVRGLWQRLDGSVGAPNNYSVQGIAKYLKSRGATLRTFYPDVAGNNLIPAQTYVEGAAYPAAPTIRSWTIRPGRKTRSTSTRLPHLTSRSYVAKPGAGLTGAWRLRIRFDGPKRLSGAGAYVMVVTGSGAVQRRQVALNKAGDATVRVAFGRAQARRVYVTLANAGIRYQCQQSRPYACSGTPLSDGKAWKLTLTAARAGS